MASNHRGFVKKRTTLLFLVFSLLYLAIAARLFYVQVVRTDYYKNKAAKIRVRQMPVKASRGTIRDRSGRLLAVNIETSSVFANLREISDPSKTAVQVAALLGEDSASITEKLTGDRKFIWLGRQVDARIGDQVRKNRAKLPGIGTQSDTKRVYPLGPPAAQILGFTDIDNKGVEGIECVQDKVLRGADGLVVAELDSERRVIPETRHVIREPKDGRDVYLTIDTTIQHIAEQALAKMGEKYHPDSACAIVIRPQTGEILALANYPTYDANKARNTNPSLWRNRAVADLYEPGSTLKVITVAAGLNEGLNPRAAYAYCTGKEKMTGGRVVCSLHHPYESGHGSASMYRIIEQSCNIGAAHIALRLGGDKLRKYEKGFGLMNKMNAGFGCEAGCPKIPEDEWRPLRIANIGFGQGIAVSALQMASVYATIANSGVRVSPRIIREIRNSDGTVYASYKLKSASRVISREAATELTRMLVSCVDNGTGKTASIPGRSVAGKTGSAQVARRNGRGYEAGAFVASFMGFAPANKPELAIAVVVHRPKGSHWGATVAAPIFKEIGEKGLWYLKVPADEPGVHHKEPGDRKRLVFNSSLGRRIKKGA